MNTCKITFEEQNHYIDYDTEMINEAHIVCIFPRDQKLINLIGAHCHMIKLLTSTDPQLYDYQEPLSERAKSLKKTIAKEIRTIFK